MGQQVVVVDVNNAPGKGTDHRVVDVRMQRPTQIIFVALDDDLKPAP